MTWGVVSVIAIIALLYLLVKKGGQVRVTYRGLGQQFSAEYIETETKKSA